MPSLGLWKHSLLHSKNIQNNINSLAHERNSRLLVHNTVDSLRDDIGLDVGVSPDPVASPVPSHLLLRPVVVECLLHHTVIVNLEGAINGDHGLLLQPLLAQSSLGVVVVLQDKDPGFHH